MRLAGVSNAATLLSAKKSVAPLSATIVATWDGSAPAGNGATATPARRAPMKTAAYSMALAPQIAMACVGCTPPCCSAAATLSMNTSSSRQLMARSPCLSAGLLGFDLACSRARSAMARNGGGPRAGRHGVAHRATVNGA